jgi:hypothetical protein
MAGFLGKLLFSSTSRSRREELGNEKRERLRALTREIQANRFSRFYKPRMEEAGPAMGKYFFDIYKNIVRARNLLRNDSDLDRLRQITVETYMGMACLDARQRLSADYVTKRVKERPLSEVSSLLDEDFRIFAADFDASFCRKVDHCYGQILSIIEVVNFDYLFLLRKFNPAISEWDSCGGSMGPVWGRLLLGSIVNFLEASFFIQAEPGWTLPLHILKVYKSGADVFIEEEWEYLLNCLRDLRRSSILELIVRHINREPGWEFRPRLRIERVAAGYLEERRQEIDRAMAKAAELHRQRQTAALTRELFGDYSEQRLQHYTDKAGEIFRRKGQKGFVYAKQLNYLKIFIDDFFMRDIRSMCELLLFRGIWQGAERSDGMYHVFNTLSDVGARLTALDRSVGENMDKMRIIFAKAERDKSQMGYLTFMFQRINTEARSILENSAEALGILGEQFKQIIADKEGGRIITNYRELKRERDTDLTPHLVLCHKRINAYLYIQQFIVLTHDPVSA